MRAVFFVALYPSPINLVVSVDGKQHVDLLILPAYPSFIVSIQTKVSVPLLSFAQSSLFTIIILILIKE